MKAVIGLEMLAGRPERVKSEKLAGKRDEDDVVDNPGKSPILNACGYRQAVRFVPVAAVSEEVRRLWWERTMWIDVGLGVVVLFFGLMGLFQGVIVQLFRLGGLVLIIFYARLVAEPIGQWLAGHLPLNPIIAYYVSFVAGALIVYAVCSLMGRAVHKAVTTGGETQKQANRMFGGILGLVKGLVVAFVLASLIDMIPAARLSRWETAQEQVATSRFLRVVHPVNPLPELRFLADVDDYKKILADPEAQRILQRQPAFAQLQDHAKFRVAVDDKGLRKLIEEKRWPEVLVHKRVLALIFDRDIRRILNDLDPKAALEEAERSRSDK